MIHDWSEKKNSFLKENRRISFERILIAIDEGGLVDILEHPDPLKYNDQKMYVIVIDEYCWVVPFRDDKEANRRYLITAFPSRKLTKKYLQQ